MRFEFFIATRYLRAKRRQAFIGIINGFRQDLQERLIGSTSHVSLLRIADDGIKDWPPLVARLAKQPHVVAAAPAIFEQVLISRGPRARGAILKGMIPAAERKVGDRLNTIKEGSAAALDEDQNPAPSNQGSSKTDSPNHPEGDENSTPESPDSLAAVHARV